MADTFAEDLALKFRAGFPIIAINTDEEDRCVQEITYAAWLTGHGHTLPLGQTDRATLQTLCGQYAGLIGLLQPHGLLVDVPQLNGVLQLTATVTGDDVIPPEEHAFLLKATGLLERILDTAGHQVVTWESDQGFSHSGREDGQEKLHNALLSTAVLWDEDRELSESKENLFPRRCVIVFKDIHLFLNTEQDPQWRRALRHVFAKSRLVNHIHRHHLILLQPNFTPHRDISHCVHLVEFAPPDEKQLEQEISYTERSLVASQKTGVVTHCPPALRKDVVRALQGFTQHEANNALSLGAVKHRGFAPEIIPTLHRLKADALRKDEVLEYIDAATLADMADVGGFENYFDFIKECQAASTDEASAAGLKRPKGVVLLGPTGTCKTVVAKATAKLFRLQLIAFDVGALFGGVVGQTESNTRQALRRIQAMGPCVLLLDEADKIFSGMDRTAGDSGVGQRVFGSLLRWLDTGNSNAFVIPTMNSIEGVPDALLRPGRFDAVFYTEFPGPEARRDILTIHMSKNHVNVALFTEKEWQRLLNETEDYVGADLEQIVVQAVRTSWLQRQCMQPTGSELLQARSKVKASATRSKELIKAILDRCQDTAIPVSRKPVAGKRNSSRQPGSVLLGPG